VTLNRALWWGGVLLLVSLLLVALFAPTLAGSPPERQRWALSAPPASAATGSKAFQSGARASDAGAGEPKLQLAPDATQAEIWHWWVRATRNVVLVTVSVASLALVLGGLLGALAIYSARGIGVALARLVELTGALPSLILIGVLRFWDPTGGILALVGTLAVLRALDVAQLVRTHVLHALLSDHVEASRALGASRRWQFRVHILPALIGPLLVHLAFGASSVVGLEAALSFAGLGLPVEIPSWGGALGQIYKGGSPLGIAGVALSIGLTSAALYAVGARLAAELQPV
jgi:ABC-type dipeptide/oligopeptide/nickel transport system permease subunit